jgi:Reverse transcriptase (RNA-dependent DNA polymerase)
VFQILKKGERAPSDYKMIPMWIIFNIKMGPFQCKARLVAGGHVTAPPSDDTYSSITSKESVQPSFLISALNNLDLVSVDITNAYVHAECREKVATIAGPEFGEYEGCIVLVIKALYGLKSSGAVWHAHLSERL